MSECHKSKNDCSQVHFFRCYIFYLLNLYACPFHGDSRRLATLKFHNLRNHSSPPHPGNSRYTVTPATYSALYPLAVPRLADRIISPGPSKSSINVGSNLISKGIEFQMEEATTEKALFLGPTTRCTSLIDGNIPHLPVLMGWLDVTRKRQPFK